MLNALYRTAGRLGVDVLYEAEVVDLDIEDGACRGATFRHDGQARTIKAASVVAACGGFESNIPWMKEYWGEAAENFLIRGTANNQGKVLRLLLDKGIQEVGDPTQCHAVAIDARAPKYDGGIVTRLDCVVFGIVVNQLAKRFYDEGEDLWPRRYAAWGRLIAQEPGQIAYIVFDSRSATMFMPSVYPPFVAPTIEELAAQLDLDATVLANTVREFNASVVDGTFDHTILDDCRTENLTPAKSHWARRIDAPPYYAYPVRPGITFTYLGVRVDKAARMLMADGRPTANLFAAKPAKSWPAISWERAMRPASA